MVTGNLVGTSTSIGATWYPNQRKCFYAKGLHWVFYSDGTNMVYKTSADGVNWSAPTTIRPCTSGYMFSVWYDPVNDYLHYAYAPNTAGGDLMYRRGRPNADGTITWSTTTEQTAYDAAYSAGIIAEYIYHPFVSVDSNGYPWIGFYDFEAVGVTEEMYVTKSSTNDGTWVTASGFPYALATVGGCVSPIPLTAGKMLVVYGSSSLTVKARAWNGSAWLTEVATTSAVDDDYAYSAVAQGDDVHLIFLKYTTFDILYVKYSYASNSFGTETTLQSATTSTTAPVLSIDPNTNDLYVFWAGSPTANHIYYRKHNASTGTWETAVDWLDESAEALTDNDRLTTFYNILGGYLGLAYMTGTAYNVKFAFLSITPPPPPPPVSRVSISDFLKGFGEDNVYSGKAYSQYDNVIKAADASRAFEVSLLDAWNNGTSDTTIGFRFGAGTIRFQKKLSPDSGFIINLIKAKWRGPTNTPFNIYSYDPTPRISFTVTGELV